MLLIVYQTNTGHRAVCIYNESNAQKNISQMLSLSCFVVHELSSFCAHCIAIFADAVVITHQCIFLLRSFFTSTVSVPRTLWPLSSLEYFEASASLCVGNGILLNIGRNFWHSLVLRLQISIFPCSLKRSVTFVELYSLKNFIFSLSEAMKRNYFCFLLLIQRSAAQ